MKFPLRKSKTSDFFEGKFRGFDMKVRMFGAKKSDVFGFRFPPPQKSFMKISYISYTKAKEALYLLTISGEGLGVG